MHQVIHKITNFFCCTVAGLDRHDSMTGLLNSSAIRNRLRQAIKTAKKQSQHLSLIILDIDRFKLINDTYGHSIGDRVIIALARVLEKIKPERALVGRMGGEEFMIVLPDTDREESEDLADQIQEEVRKLEVHAGQQRIVTFTVSLGLAVYPAHARTFQELIERTDIALYVAKALGRNIHVFWSPTAEAKLEQGQCLRPGEPPSNLPIVSTSAKLVFQSLDQSTNNWTTIIGRTNYRYYPKLFGIRKSDRRYHVYIVGQTGTGKTTLLENMIRQDIHYNEGLAVLDPHGDFVENILAHVPEHRKDDFIYFDVPDPNSPYGFNPLANVPRERRALVASGMVEAFKKIWEKTWGARMEHILRNVFLTLLDVNDTTLADVRRLFFDASFRREAVLRVTNPEVRDFWFKEFASYPPRYRIEAINPILNKVGAFLSDPNMNRVFTQGKTFFDIRKIMDEGGILVVNLAKGRIGADNSTLMGALLVSAIGTTALSRADIPEKKRRDFYLYIDEFQNFTTLTMANMLSELRKYGLSMTMAHQYLAQLEPEIRDAVLGNVGTVIAFRIGLPDAKTIKDKFWPKFDEHDLINLSNYNIYVKMVIDGESAQPFSAQTLKEIPEIYLPAFSQWFGNSVVGQLCGNLARFIKYSWQGNKSRPLNEC